MHWRAASVYWDWPGVFVIQPSSCSGTPVDVFLGIQAAHYQRGYKLFAHYSSSIHNSCIFLCVLSLTESVNAKTYQSNDFNSRIA